MYASHLGVEILEYVCHLRGVETRELEREALALAELLEELTSLREFHSDEERCAVLECEEHFDHTHVFDPTQNITFITHVFDFIFTHNLLLAHHLHCYILIRLASPRAIHMSK